MPEVAGVTVDEARLAEVCSRYGIARLRVFGSVARGTATPDSDMDVLYELKPGHRLGWEIEQLADELAAVFGRPVDLVSRRPPPANEGCRAVGGTEPLCGVSSSCSKR
ncbi:MAG: nucleotidyltransferase family protein [Actinomycetes bacterium]